MTLKQVKAIKTGMKVYTSTEASHYAKCERSSHISFW